MRDSSDFCKDPDWWYFTDKDKKFLTFVLVSLIAMKLIEHGTITVSTIVFFIIGGLAPSYLSRHMVPKEEGSKEKDS